MYDQELDQATAIRCTVCDGDKVIACDECDGYGYYADRSSGKLRFVNCPDCQGKGYITCPHCDGSGEEPTHE